MNLFALATPFLVGAIVCLAMILRRVANEQPMLPWDYGLAISMMVVFALCQIPSLSNTPQFINVAPPSKPEGGSFVAVGLHGISTSSLNDPAIKKLFETSGGLGADQDCKKHGEEIAKFTSTQLDELVKILTQVFDPGRAGPPPLTTSMACALGIAADIDPLDPRLVGPLLVVSAKGDFSAAEAAGLLKTVKVLPAEIVKAELDRLDMKGAGNFLAVLKQVPVDSFDSFAEQLSSTTGVQEIGYLIVLARSPHPYPQVAEHIRRILASPGSEDRRLAAVIASTNSLPASESLRLLEPLARSSGGAVTLHAALAAANDKAAFSPLVPLMLESWDPFDLMGNDIRVDTLAQFGRGLTPSLPLIARKMVLIPPNTPDWDKKRHAAAERCYRSLGGSSAPPESTCSPDVSPPLNGNCEGRLSEISERLKKIIRSFDTSDPALLGKVRELLRASEPAVREFAVHLLARMEDRASRELLRSVERDSSRWVAATAFSTEQLLAAQDAGWIGRANGFLKDSRRDGCFTSSAFLQALPGLGTPGAEALLSEVESGAMPVVAARSLAEAKQLPTDFEPRLVALLASSAVQRCADEQLISPLLTALFKIDPISDNSLSYVRRVFNGDELRCCTELVRLRAAFDALASVAAEKPAALALLKAKFTLAQRLRGGESEVNRALLAASPTEGRRLMREVGAIADNERRMANIVSQVRNSSKSCLGADGTIVELVKSPEIGPKSTGQEIAAHFASVSAEIDGKGIDSSKGEVARLLGGDVASLERALEQDGTRLAGLRNADCESLLHVAIREGKTEHLRAIVRHRPELNLRDRSGRTALMRAAEKNDLEGATLLLDAGAEIDLHDYGSQNSETALTLASNRQAREVVKLLFARGASESAGNPRVPLETSLLASEDPELIEIVNRRKQSCTP